MPGPGSAQGRELSPDGFAFWFDGKGGGTEIPVTDAIAALDGPDTRPGRRSAQQGFVWVHCRRGSAPAVQLAAGNAVDSLVMETLSADETRPRTSVYSDDSVLLNLRGVNLNPGSEPEDMISVRFWMASRLVLGIWVRPLVATLELVAAIRKGHCPATPGELIARLALRIADNMEPVISELGERIDALELVSVNGSTVPHRRELAELRRSSIALRRFMAPQRDALITLEIEDLTWLGERDRSRLREASDRILRMNEELEMVRERASVVHDELMDARAERMNKQMVILSVVAAIFLPLSLLAGMLGMNVGGIPGLHDPDAFWVISLFMLVIAALLGLAVRWLRII
ncbi:MAG: zinc transporter ZntB [Nitratireductor sp.]|nr:zinc transporter ZntB [Nitratireductor sp.]